mmetsp:Transcript_16255/g.42102  ORF Transcript_16255/g.42102 Transcript_16255/m.42102 type:complete len:351 (+) Transcript_16255:1821-2873(+)
MAGERPLQGVRRPAEVRPLDRLAQGALRQGRGRLSHRRRGARGAALLRPRALAAAARARAPVDGHGRGRRLRGRQVHLTTLRDVPRRRAGGAARWLVPVAPCESQGLDGLDERVPRRRHHHAPRRLERGRSAIPLAAAHDHRRHRSRREPVRDGAARRLAEAVGHDRHGRRRLPLLRRVRRRRASPPQNARGAARPDSHHHTRARKVPGAPHRPGQDGAHLLPRVPAALLGGEHQRGHRAAGQQLGAYPARALSALMRAARAARGSDHCDAHRTPLVIGRPRHAPARCRAAPRSRTSAPADLHAHLRAAASTRQGVPLLRQGGRLVHLAGGLCVCGRDGGRSDRQRHAGE